jgi:GntR family transcriptional regulator
MKSPAQVADDPRLYEQVVALLRNDIAAGRLRAGERLSSERVLSERLGVSRVTLRRALAELVERRLLVPAARRGWFVSHEPHDSQPPPLQSFTEWARLQGLEVVTKVLRSRRRDATKTELRLLQLDDGSQIFEFERLRQIRATPFAVDRSRVPLALAPFLPDVDFSHASLFAVLRERAGIVPTRADSMVKIEAAGRRTARLLDVAEGSSLLRFTELVFDQSGRRFEIHDAWNRGEGYRWTSVLDAFARGDAVRP